jgi:broad specificity phosphatase PhoE
LQNTRIVSSDLRRAVESASLLAPGSSVLTTPLLREMSVIIPSLRGVRLPLKFWAVVVGVPFMRATKRNDAAGSYAKELERAAEAARWLSELAATHESVAAVTHGAFRHCLAFALERAGWIPSPARRRSDPWSAWELAKSLESAAHR